MDREAGFTIIELIIVIIIIGILVTISVGTQNSFLPLSRDSERAEDIASIARLLEIDYTDQLVLVGGVASPSYPSTTTFINDIASGSGTAARTDKALFTAPNQSTTSVVAAATTNAATPETGNQPPVINKYYYQPIRRDGTLCTDSSQACVLYRLIYRSESGSSVIITRSSHQQ